MHKKGVTEPVLMIGVLVLAATILLLGSVKVITPLIKSQPNYLAYDFALTMNAVYAAPENLVYDKNFPINDVLGFANKNGAVYVDSSAYIFYTKDAQVKHEYKNYKLYSKSEKKDSMTYEEVYQFNMQTDGKKTMIFDKSYTATNSKIENKLTVSCTGCQQ